MDFTFDDLRIVAKNENVKLPNYFWIFWHYYWYDEGMRTRLIKSSIFGEHVELWNKLVFIYTVKYYQPTKYANQLIQLNPTQPN